MKRKSSRISTSAATTSTSTAVSTIPAEKKAEKSKSKSTWYCLGSDKKKVDDACEPTSSILSYYQGLALSLPTSLPTCLFPVATNPKWEKNVEKGTYLTYLLTYLYPQLLSKLTHLLPKVILDLFILFHGIFTVITTITTILIHSTFTTIILLQVPIAILSARCS